MSLFNNEQTYFYKTWFRGLMKGLGQADQGAQDVILNACGQACARSYALITVFQ